MNRIPKIVLSLSLTTLAFGGICAQTTAKTTHLHFTGLGSVLCRVDHKTRLFPVEVSSPNPEGNIDKAD